MNKPLVIGASALGAIAIFCILFTGCKRGIDTPFDTKYLTKFHELTTTNEIQDLQGANLALYVDYSTCIADGKHSPFYQNMVSPLTAATKEYWSIKGNEISREDISQNGGVFGLLNNVQEVNYAALDNAISQMAQREGESILLTDGELFVQTVTKDNPNNPYMHDAFKNWIMKGHDIHILAEPYVETYHGQSFNKKRFYIIFTDDRLQGNIYDRIVNTIDLSNFPNVDEYHLSGNYPWLVPTNGRSSQPNSTLAAEITPQGNYEIQDWPLDWKTIQTVIISNAYDEAGNPLPMGEKIIGGLKVNRNAFGCYRIKDIDVKVYNINSEYNDIYNRLEAGEKVGPENSIFYEIPSFITFDRNEFNNHSNIDLYFDINNFAPDKGTDLNGKDFNFFKIVISVKEVENILANNIDIFNFESIAHPGQTNVSISESLKQSVYDPDIVNMLNGKVLYTIYVKSGKY